MSYTKQHEIGLAGLALLRNRSVGDEKTTQEILDEICKLTKTPKNALSSPSKVKEYSVKAGYQAWAATYDKIPNLLVEVEEPVVKSLLRKFPAGRALDAACGTGRYSKFLHELGHEVTGVDFSPAMLRHAKTRNRKIKFIRGNLGELPLANNNFDLVICTLALTHFSDIKQPLTELYRVVRSGGYIIISDIHWHATYLQAFNQIGLKVFECLEPTMGQEHLKLARTGFDLSTKTVRVAFLRLPIALIWVLGKF